MTKPEEIVDSWKPWAVLAMDARTHQVYVRLTKHFWTKRGAQRFVHKTRHMNVVLTRKVVWNW